MSPSPEPRVVVVVVVVEPEHGIPVVGLKPSVEVQPAGRVVTVEHGKPVVELKPVEEVHPAGKVPTTGEPPALRAAILAMVNVPAKPVGAVRPKGAKISE